MAEKQSAWNAELDDLLRGAAGGYLFGTPFLYTMEMWWNGSYAEPRRCLAALVIAFAALLALSAASGFRKQTADTWPRIISESAEALALALLLSALSLWMINQLNLDLGLEPALGRIVMLALPFSIGVGVAGQMLGREAQNEGKDGGKKRPDRGIKGTLADAGATMLGATIVCFSIAPTEEIPRISMEAGPAQLLIVVFASLALSYIIVFEACFSNQQRRRSQEGIFQSPTSETAISYIISLVTAVVMLTLFQLLRPGDPLGQWVSYTIILGFPATLGGAAGRLAV